MTTYTCPHCDRQFERKSSRGRHEKICIDGPAGDAVRALVHEMSVGGHAPSYEEYEKARDEGMLSSYVFTTQYGGWFQFVESLGLIPRRVRAGGPGKEAWARIVSIVDSMKAEHERFMMMINDSQHGTYGQALHEWKERTCEKAGREKTEYYTVLR